MNTAIPTRWLGRFLALVLLLSALYAIDFVNLSWSAAARSAPAILLLVALLDSAVVALLAAILPVRGWRLIGILFLLFYGLKTFLVGIEAVYLTDVLTPSLTRALFVNGLLVALIFAPAAVWLLGRLQGHCAPQPPAGPRAFNLGATAGWLGRLLLSGVLYFLLFIAAGLLLFTPVAAALDPTAAAAYFAGFEAPAWLPLFIIARGIVWALLALPALSALPHRSWSHGLALGLLFAVLMANNLLFPGDIAPTIRAAHFVELFVANLLYGLLLVWLFAPRRQAFTASQPAPHLSPSSP